MSRLGVIDRLPQAVREEIGSLRQAGRTIDEILAHLEDAHGYKLVRSTLGLHVQKLDKLGERLRESQAAAEALVRPLADAGEDRMLRALIASLQAMMMDVIASKAGEDVVFDAEEFMQLCRGLRDLGSARKADAELTQHMVAKAEERAKKAAAERSVEAVRQLGLQVSTEQLRAIREQVYGIRS